MQGKCPDELEKMYFKMGTPKFVGPCSTEHSEHP